MHTFHGHFLLCQGHKKRKKDHYAQPLTLIPFTIFSKQQKEIIKEKIKIYQFELVIEMMTSKYKYLSIFNKGSLEWGEGEQKKTPKNQPSKVLCKTHTERIIKKVPTSCSCICCELCCDVSKSSRCFTSPFSSIRNVE